MFATTCFGPPWPSSGSLCWALLKLQFFFVEFIDKNISLCDLRCCGNKYFRLWCMYCVPCSVRVVYMSDTLHGMQYTHHRLKYLLAQHRKSHNDIFLVINSTKNCSFSKAQHKLPEDGPIGPEHVEANVEIF
jgi:hypothetical protein